MGLCQNFIKSQVQHLLYLSKHQINLEIRLPQHNLLSLYHLIISWCLSTYYFIISSIFFSATLVNRTYSNVLSFLFFKDK